MTDAMTTQECLDSQTHATSCCEGGRRPAVPFYERNTVRIVGEPSATCTIQAFSQEDIDEIRAIHEGTDKAAQVIQERGEVYGPFDVNMYGTALQISGMLAQYYGRTDLPVLPAYMAAMIATAFKSNRIVKSPTHEDSHLDHGNYLEIARKLGAESASPPNHIVNNE